MEDMRHAHKMESLKRPEMTIDPSPALQRRPVGGISSRFPDLMRSVCALAITSLTLDGLFLQGHNATSSVHRGSQLLGKIRGSRNNEQNVYVSSLVAVHSFDEADKDVIVLS